MKTNLPACIRQEAVDHWTILCSKAYEVVQGPDYNRISFEARNNPNGSSLLFYEIVCSEDRSWEFFRKRVFPSFVRYLRYKSLDPESGQGLIVSLYDEEQFHLIRGCDFVKAFCEIEGIDPSIYRLYIRRWLSEAPL